VDGTEVLFLKEGHLTARDRGSGPILGFVAANDGPNHHPNRWLDRLSNADADADAVVAVGVGQPYAWGYGGSQSIHFRKGALSFQQQLTGISGGYPIRIPNIAGNALSKELT
jgi:hypothetical protein